ncbi:MAG TPA: hypothetical protein VGD08_13620 [Stellaceae bacterium]
MAAYRFKAGQSVTMLSRMGTGLPTGKFKIVRLLPTEGGNNQYRIKSVVDGHERVVLESEIT